MPRNIEIKARVREVSELTKKAQQLAGNEGQLTEQEDTFFYTSHGRLKLRVEQGSETLLIHYDRPNTEGPKLSDFSTAVVNDTEAMKKVLTKAFGIQGLVRKSRLLLLFGQTRIHIDKVHGLGDFMELEVGLKDDQTKQDGQLIAEDIMQLLDIQKGDLLDGSYMDMILKASN